MHERTPPTDAHDAAHRALAAFALAYPEAREDFPWGDHVAKVRGKVFVFMGADGNGFGLSCKLPHSSDRALLLPFAKPTAYGLGKSGWVTARFEPGEDVPIDILCEWIDESFRAIAPKKLVATLPPM